MNISAWAIRKPVPTILFFSILVIVGLVAFFRLGINDNPDIDFPLVVITVPQPGAAPSELETEITRKVEDAVVGIEGLEHVRSTVTDGASTTMLEFKIGTKTDRALNDVRDAVSRIRGNLPADILEPQITHPNFSGEPFAIYSVSSRSRTVAELSRLVDEDITRSLLTVSGISQVRRSGGLDREIRIQLDPGRLQAVGTSVDAISQQIRAFNVNLPGGRAEVAGAEQAIRTLGSAATVEQLRSLQVTLPSGQHVPLVSLGTIEDTTAIARQSAWLQGEPVVAFSLVRSQGTPLVDVAHAAQKHLESTLIPALPDDLTVELISSRADFDEDSYHASLDALYLGSGLAIVVIWLFLRNWQATLISALAIPLSVLGTFWVMHALGYTLNFMTLLGLILAVGILVDDAIVDLENIYRHIAMGKSPLQAAFEATDEIGLAIVATTLTIVAVFVPVAFMGGIPGQFFRSFGLTISVSVLFSLLVARTLTPMMGAYLLPAAAEHEEETDTWFTRLYARVLAWALDHRGWTAFGAVVVFVGSMALTPLLPATFMDVGDINQAAITVSLPTGSTLADTERVVHQVTQVLNKRPEVKKVFATIGASVQNGLANEGGAVTNAMVNVLLVDASERTVSQDQFEDLTRPDLQQIPGARIAYIHFGAAGSQKPVNVILKGNDAQALDQAADQLLAQMRQLPGLQDVTSSAAELRPELRVIPDPVRAAEQGVSVATIARAARMATQGDLDTNLPKFNAGDRQVNIRVQLADWVRQDLQQIGDLMVQGSKGLVPLRTVADIEFGSGPVQIDRYDRARQVTLAANLNGIPLGDATQQVLNLPIMKDLPPGVTHDSDGEAKVMQDVFTEVVIALGAGVMFIYAVLVLLFGNFLHPLTIMVALPLSIGGAFIGLLLTGKPLGLMSLVGIIMLMGLVTKNSILLVEYALMAMEQGMERRAALMKAGAARLRPILMTTVAMIAGMMPIALSFGTGTGPRSPMAVAVIGGLVTSTLFTLVVIPAVFTFMDDFQLRAFKLLRRLAPKGSVTTLERPHGT